MIQKKINVSDLPQTWHVWENKIWANCSLCKHCISSNIIPAPKKLRDQWFL